MQLDKLICTGEPDEMDIIDKSFLGTYLCVQNRSDSLKNYDLNDLKTLFLMRLSANKMGIQVSKSDDKYSLRLLMVGLLWDAHPHNTTSEVYIKKKSKSASFVIIANLKSSFYQIFYIANQIQKSFFDQTTQLEQIKCELLASIVSFAAEERIFLLLENTFDKLLTMLICFLSQKS